MEKGKIEIIYQIIMRGIPMTTQVLIEHGFTLTEIEVLISENIIKAVDLDKYELVSPSGLYNYGVRLFLMRNFRNAQQCFLKCFELDSSDRKYCLQLMLMQLRLRNTGEVFNLFAHLEQISSEEDTYDNNLYLYLLNLISKCPEEYNDRLQSMDYDSFLLPSSTKTAFKFEQNNIRQSIIKNKTKNALRLQNNLITRRQVYSIKDEFLKELIVNLVNLESRFKLKLLELANTKSYHAIISFLDHKAKKRYLTNEETYSYLISKAIIEMSETHVIPVPTDNAPQNIYAAIKSNNFAAALNLELSSLEFYNQISEEKTVYVLLSQINQLICELQNPSFGSMESPKTITKTFK